MAWKPVDLSAKFITNVQEASLGKGFAALENVYINDVGGHTRFPGLSLFATLPHGGEVYLYPYRGDLIAASGSSRVYRLDQSANIDDVTGAPLNGGKRAVFTETTQELLIAAGKKLVRFDGEETALLSDDAPESTHVAWIDDYILAIDEDSFRHSDPDDITIWEALDTFAANGQPDNINAIMITPYREVIVAGPKSVEQFERLSSGSVPFFRRWSVGEGVLAPYTLTFADNATWFVNELYEFVRSSGQTSESKGDAVGMTLEGIAEEFWTDAWAVPINIGGQKFLLLQIPRATNVYGTAGITLLFDYRKGRWSSLYGWDTTANLPTRWPGWSYASLWGRHFIGGDGKIYELSTSVFTNDSLIQRVRARSGFIREWGESRVNNVRIQLKRGATASQTTAPEIWLRANRDGKKWTRWKKKSMGLSGDTNLVVEFGAMGDAKAWQFEYMISGDAEVDITNMQVDVERIGFQ